MFAGKLLSFEDDDVEELNPGFCSAQLLECFRTEFEPNSSEYSSEEILPDLVTKHLLVTCGLPITEEQLDIDDSKRLREIRDLFVKVRQEKSEFSKLIRSKAAHIS